MVSVHHGGEGKAEFVLAGVCSLVPDVVARPRSREQNWKQDSALILEVQPPVAPPSLPVCALYRSQEPCERSYQLGTKCSEQEPMKIPLHQNPNRGELSLLPPCMP